MRLPSISFSITFRDYSIIQSESRIMAPAGWLARALPSLLLLLLLWIISFAIWFRFYGIPVTINNTFIKFIARLLPFCQDRRMVDQKKKQSTGPQRNNAGNN